MVKKSLSQSLVSITLVVCGDQGVVVEHALVLPAGARVQDALSDAQSRGIEGVHFGSGADHHAKDAMPIERQYGVWGRFVTVDTVLHHEDRLEIYRPLRVDPKLARRERFQQQGSRGTGLFARRKIGAAMGY